MTNPAMVFSRALVANLAANDIRDIVVCPGSRSGPLAHALAEAGSAAPPRGAPDIRLHVRIDERAAGFLALGLAMAQGAAAVVTTSGTAVGNLLPAMMEAHHSGVRLFAITADRPFDLRATGANQTTDQRRIFGPFVRHFRDLLPPGDGRDLAAEASAAVGEAVARSAGAAPATGAVGPGPVHINVQFAEPLRTDAGPWPAATPANLTFPPEESAPPLPAVARGIVVAGDRAGPAAATIASARGWPLLAEPTSGARSGPSVIPDYARFVASDEGRALASEAEFVLLVGRATLSRGIRAIIDGAPKLWVARHGSPWREAPIHAEVVVPDVPFSWIRSGSSGGRGPWLDRWLSASAPVRVDSWSVERVAAEVVAAGNGPLVVGSSRAIRAVDAVMPPAPASGGRLVVANRGLAGIDGTVSTAMGLALGLDASVTALIGDLTFLHDVGGLLVGTRERRPSLRIVVANDNGGTIFRALEHAESEPGAFERVFTTPHGADLGAIANGFGASHVRVRDADELRAALRSESVGVEVIEAVLA